MINILIEEDRVLRMVPILLDPETPRERIAAYADYVAHDLPGFYAWAESLRRELPAVYPSRTKMVSSQETLRESLADADVVFVESLEIRQAELDMAPRLRLIQQFGTQVDNIDLAACNQRQIAVRTISRRTNTGVAEHTMGLMLSLAKKFNSIAGVVTAGQLALRGMPFRAYDRRHTPGANYGRIGGIVQLKGSTLGLLGLGEIGSEVAALARAFGMHILYHKRNRLPAEEERAAGVSYRSMEDLFRQSDFLSIHVPSDAGSAGMVNRALLNLMKPGAFLLNTSRAEVINREALLDIVAARRLGGVALDVHYEEPVREDDPLLAHPEVMLVPHTAGGSRINGLADMREMLTGIDRHLGSPRRRP